MNTVEAVAAETDRSAFKWSKPRRQLQGMTASNQPVRPRLSVATHTTIEVIRRHQDLAVPAGIDPARYQCVRAHHLSK